MNIFDSSNTVPNVSVKFDACAIVTARLFEFSLIANHGENFVPFAVA